MNRRIIPLAALLLVVGVIAAPVASATPAPGHSVPVSVVKQHPHGPYIGHPIATHWYPIHPTPVRVTVVPKPKPKPVAPVVTGECED